MVAIKSKVLESISNITHGFGTLQNPAPQLAPASTDPKEWQSLWDARPEKKQVHGTSHFEARSLNQACGEIDGISSRTPGIPISVISADCVPILMARKDGARVAAIHSGWRGTQARILHRMWRDFWDQGEHPQDWVAAIGPAIGACCYEVSQEIADRFYIDHGGAKAVPTPRHLDLATVVHGQLIAIGVSAVDKQSPCTRCTKDSDASFSFHSYRREGGNTRQWSSIWINP